MKSTQTIKINEVWLSQFSGNCFHIDAIDGSKVSVTRLGYVTNIGQLNEQSRVSRKPNSHVWDISTFQVKDFRRIARNGAKFKSWLSQNAVNA